MKNKIADMDEIQEFWSNILRDPEEKTANRIRASELCLKFKKQQPDTALTQADRALLRKVAKRLE